MNIHWALYSNIDCNYEFYTHESDSNNIRYHILWSLITFPFLDRLTGTSVHMNLTIDVLILHPCINLMWDRFIVLYSMWRACSSCQHLVGSLFFVRYSLFTAVTERTYVCHWQTVTMTTKLFDLKKKIDVCAIFAIT